MLTLGERVAYGIGGAAFSIKEAAYAVFVLIFYTQVLGLDGALTGTILFLAVIFDAVTDPIIGAWSDRLKSRWGKRHPFMLAAIIPLGLGMLALFIPPQWVAAAQSSLGLWLLFWSIWIRVFLSAFTIPHFALSAEITRDYRQRSALIGMRMLFVFLVTVFVPALSLFFIFTGPDGSDGRFAPDHYPLYGLLSCLLMWFVGLTCIFATRGHARSSLDSNAEEPAGLRVFLTDFVGTLRNQNFRYLLFFEIAAMISYGALITVNVLVWTYYFELSNDQFSLLLAVPSLLGVVLALLVLKTLGGHWEKHTVIQYTTILLCLDAVWVYLARVAGWLPDNGDPGLFYLLMLQMMIWMFLFIMRTISTFSLIGDIADEYDLDQGKQQQGSFFAAFAFTSKLATGFGPLFGGIILSLTGIQKGMLPGTVEQSSIDLLGLIYVLGVALPLVPAWWFSLRVSLGAERFEAIQAELNRR